MSNPLINYVTENKTNYDAFTSKKKLDADECMDIVNSMTREQTIAFLHWNDPNQDNIYNGNETFAKVNVMKILWEASL